MKRWLLLALLAFPACNREALDPMSAPDGSAGGGDAAGAGVVDLATPSSNDFSTVIQNDLASPMGPGLNGGTQTSYPTGTDPTAIVAGDFNRDGHPDIAIAADADDAVDVFLGDGTGALSKYQAFPVGKGALFLASGTIDGDAVLDLVTLDADDGTVSVLLGNGDGTFRPRLVAAAGPAVSGLALADFDGDKHLDIAVGDTKNVAILFLHGMGDGTFANPLSTGLVSDGATPLSLSAGDMDQDGKPDLVIGFYGQGDDGRSTETWLSQGGGNFAMVGGNMFGVPGQHVALLADLNYDGWPDVLYAQPDPGGVSYLCNYGGNGVHCGGGDNFAAPVALAVADLDGNPYPDVVTANAGDQTLGIMLNSDVQGDFPLGKPISLAVSPTALLATDLDGDKRVDLVVVARKADQVVVLLNGK